jgi:undecaprenyl-phosphate 4-deoxy-4-formamido-L-arabinose transferase
VEHRDRQSGRSGYTLRRLFRLWLSTLVNFSVLPLRIATLMGLVLAGAGFAALAVVLSWWWRGTGPAFGWGSLMGAFLVFSGVQMVMLGVMGEYLGRMFITVNQRPQALVREVIRGGAG